MIFEIDGKSKAHEMETFSSLVRADDEEGAIQILKDWLTNAGDDLENYTFSTKEIKGNCLLSIDFEG